MCFPGRGIFYVLKFSNLIIVMYQVLLPIGVKELFLCPKAINKYYTMEYILCRI